MVLHNLAARKLPVASLRLRFIRGSNLFQFERLPVLPDHARVGVVTNTEETNNYVVGQKTNNGQTARTQFRDLSAISRIISNSRGIPEQAWELSPFHALVGVVTNKEETYNYFVGRKTING